MVAIPFIGILHKDLKISSWQLGLYDNFFVDNWGPRPHEVCAAPKTYHQFKTIGTVLQAPITDVTRPAEALYQVGFQLSYPTEAKEHRTDQLDIHDTYIECDFNQCRLSIITDKSSQMPLVRYIKDLWLTTALFIIVIPSIWYTEDTINQMIPTISEMQCSICLAPTIMLCSNSSNSFHFFMSSLNDWSLDISMTSRSGGSTYHYLYLLLSYDFWHFSIFSV